MADPAATPLDPALDRAPPPAASAGVAAWPGSRRDAARSGLGWLAGLGVLAVAAFAGFVRALPWATVFHRGEVVFAPGDAMYHLRRAFVTFEHFPRVLLTDPYVNFPDGAPIPWPPLFDLVTASAARLLVSPAAGTADTTSFETVMAWAPPLFGALTVLPIYACAREVASRGASLAAGAFFALLPISVVYGRIGNPDHHCAVAFVGALLLLVVVRLVSPLAVGGRLVRLAAALALLRVVLLLTWHGSLLYLGIAEGTLLLAAAASRRRDLFAAQALSALASLAALAFVLAEFPEPLGGPYSSIAPSRLHLLALAGVAFVAAVGAWGARPGPRTGGGASVVVQLGWLAAASLGFALAVVALPGPRAGLVPAFQFLTLADGVGARTAEQFPLFSLGDRRAGASAIHTWGYFAFLIPLAPVGLWLLVRDPARMAQARAIALWAALLGALALMQRRYGNDVAASASIGFAVCGEWAVRRLSERVRIPLSLAAFVVVACGLLLLAPPIRQVYLPWAARSFAKWTDAPGYDAAPLESPAWSLHRFARAVRAVTPETSGYFSDDGRPEYGIVAQANLGHALQWVARRPTPTDPFWAYIGPANWDRAFGLLGAADEARAVELARELRARFVVTTPGTKVGGLESRLHEGDGLRSGDLPRLARFRLVTEGPRGGLPLSAIFDSSDPGTPRAPATPYKLFEIVEGAVLEVAAEPGAVVEVSVAIFTAAGRALRYGARARSDDEGVARLRVPYANEPVEPVDPLRTRVAPRWLVRISSASATERREAFVSEQAVRDGLRVAVAPAGS